MYNIGDIVPFNGKLYKIVPSESNCTGCDFFNNPIADINLCHKINNLVHDRCRKKIYVEIKDMKKADLHTGMIVKTRAGHRLFVLRQEEEVILFDNDHFCGRFLQDNLTNSSNSNLDIVEVFQPEYFGSLTDMLKTTNSIWKRYETIELTLQDIAKKFNISVDKLRIKE